MHPTAMRLADHAAELPDQGHEGVARAREAFVDARAIQQLYPGRARDRRGGLIWDDAEFGLCLGQRNFNVKPGLPAVL